MQTQTLPQQDDRRLLADVHRWLRTNGWTNTWRGWIDGKSLDDCRVAVLPQPDDGYDPAVMVTRRRANGYGWGRQRRYDVADVRQAVDLLVALDILPPHFSSAYKAAVEDARGVIEAATTLTEAFDFGSTSAQDAAVQALGDAVAAFEIDSAERAR